MTGRYRVSRVIGTDLVHVGTIDVPVRGMERFCYAETYLDGHGVPLSLSLPLRSEAYDADDIGPYFRGLLPEGPMRRALASKLRVQETDWPAMLESLGLDCAGDLVVEAETEEGTAVRPRQEGTYTALDHEGLCAVVSDLSALADSCVRSHLSLAGNQGKVGLLHMSGTPLSRGWQRPEAGAASTHILKVSADPRVAEAEAICMVAARRCGIRAAEAHLLHLGRPVVCVERFDRKVTCDGGGVDIERLHQEDLAQAFSLSPRSKYLELPAGTYARMGELLRRRSANPLADIEQLARIAVFDYLVGNCDNHLKNLSLIHTTSSLRLAPAYDIVCTTIFKGVCRQMGRRLGTAWLIDDVRPDDFLTLSKELGLGPRRMRRICAELSETVPEALRWAGEHDADVIRTLPSMAQDLVLDMEPRRKVAGRA